MSFRTTFRYIEELLLSNKKATKKEDESADNLLKV